MNVKKIGVLGSGIVGQTLATGFSKHGYEVTIGTRNSEKLLNFIAKNPQIKISSFADAAAFGEIIVLAAKGTIAHETLKLAGENNLNGKTIIDATNPIAEAPPENGVLKFFTDLNESLMEKLQKQFPSAHFVKSFSCVGNAFMVNPDFGGVKPSMFICGNNDEAKNQLKHILTQFGWEIEDMGKAEAARAIEPLCMLWCIPGMLNNQWSHAFKLLKK